VDFNSWKTNPELENNGVWIPCGNGKVLIASTGSERYQKALAKGLEPHEVTIALGELKEEVAKEIYIKVTAETIVLNWEGFTEDGVAVPYTVENARRLLAEVPRFREFVKAQSQRISNFQDKKEEVEAKNS
jgi:hypothetical protein